jgi:pentatricopeptide repeat protein
MTNPFDREYRVLMDEVFANPHVSHFDVCLIWKSWVENKKSPILLEYLNKFIASRNRASYMGTSVEPLLLEIRALKVKPDLRTFQLLIEGLASISDIQQSIAVLSYLKETQLPVSLDFLNSLMQAYAQHNNLNGTLLIYGEIKKGTFPGISPDLVTYSTLARVFVCVGNVQTCVSVFEAMIADGLPPTSDFMNNLLKAAWERDNAQAALTLFGLFPELGLTPTVAALELLVDTLRKAGYLAEALGYFRELRNQGLPASPAVYVALLTSLNQATPLSGVAVLQEDVARCLAASPVTYAPPLAAFNSMLLALSKVNDFSTAWALYEQMQALHVTPDLLTLNSMLLANSGLPAALRVYAELKARGLQPDVSSFGALFQAAKGDVAVTQQFLHDFIPLNLQPNSAMFEALLHTSLHNAGCGPGGFFERAVLSLSRPLLPDTFWSRAGIAMAEAGNLRGLLALQAAAPLPALPTSTLESLLTAAGSRGQLTEALQAIDAWAPAAGSDYQLFGLVLLLQKTDATSFFYIIV